MYMAGVVKTVIDHYAKLGFQLKRAFKRSVFAAATWNFPPQAQTVPHRDSGNAPTLHCSITALGDFDSDKGGHIVLYELGMVIRFPSGSTFRLCSSSVTHANIPIQPEESRSSFVQYMAGGLARHIAYGFKSEKYLSQEERDYHASHVEERWEESLDLFSTPESLAEDRQPLMAGSYSTSS
jgi:hypothetical protein